MGSLRAFALWKAHRALGVLGFRLFEAWKSLSKILVGSEYVQLGREMIDTPASNCP